MYQPGQEKACAQGQLWTDGAYHSETLDEAIRAMSPFEQRTRDDVNGDEGREEFHDGSEYLSQEACAGRNKEKAA